MTSVPPADPQETLIRIADLEKISNAGLPLRHYDALFLCSLAREAVTLKQTFAQISEAVDRKWEGVTAQQILEAVQGLRREYQEVCERLQITVTKHNLGLGGERIDKLVCDQLDYLMGH
jgi:hypothetical protein